MFSHTSHLNARQQSCSNVLIFMSIQKPVGNCQVLPVRDHYTSLPPESLKKTNLFHETYKASSLLEDLSVSPLVLLTVDGDWLLPSPLVINELLVLWLRGIKLGERITLVVWSDIESVEGILTTDDESTLDDRVTLNPVDGSTTEDVLAGTLKTSEETTNEVGSHEDFGKLIVILIIDLPERVLLGVEVLPEPLESNWGVRVGVLALPLINRNGWLSKGLNWVLGLWCRWSLVLFFLDFLCLWLRSLLLGLLLWGSFLLGRGVLDGFINEGELVNDSGVDWLVVDGLVPTGNIGVLGTPLLVEEELETTGDDTSSVEISKGDTLTGKVSVVLEVGLDGTNGLQSSLGGVLNSELVVWGTSDQRTEPTSESGEDIMVEVRHPLENGGIAVVLLVRVNR